MKKILTLSIAAVLFIGITTTANATTINYDVSNLGGNTWEYNYTVQNDSMAGDIEEFTIWFDYALYDNLVVTSPLLNWDEIVIQPDTFIPDDGFYDALALSSGIAPGASETGYSVSFDWLGTGAPGSQLFEIIDANTFDIIDSGNTSAVPEPSTFLLIGAGLMGMALIRKKLKGKGLRS